MVEDQQALRDATQLSSRNEGMATYFGNSQTGVARGSMWGSLLPQQEVAPSQDLFPAWSPGEGRPIAPGASCYDSIYEGIPAFPEK